MAFEQLRIDAAHKPMVGDVVDHLLQKEGGSRSEIERRVAAQFDAGMKCEVVKATHHARVLQVSFVKAGDPYAEIDTAKFTAEAANSLS